MKTYEEKVPEEVRQAIAVATQVCREEPKRGYLPYALSYLEKVPEVARRYEGEEEVKTQILYALNNLAAWRGPAAREVKHLLQKYAVKGLCLLSSFTLLAGCTTNVDKAKPSTEALGSRFVLEAQASVEGYGVFVLRDKVTGKLVYLTPGSGVDVQEED
jgi:hypothetical protein